MTIRKGAYHRRTEQSGFSYGAERYAVPAYQEPARKREMPQYVSSVSKTVSLELNKGDMVQHTAFGRGMVLSVMKMGGDALLEIAFDDIGTKKLMAKTASAHMKKL